MLGINNITYIKDKITLIINIGEENTISYLNIKANINDIDIFNYLEKLFLIIDSWHTEYSNSNIIDGDNWQLLITYTNGRIKNYFGHAAFPNNFEAFERINQDMIKSVS